MTMESMNKEPAGDKPRRLIVEDWCSLLVPEPWVWEEDSGITSIFRRSDSKGAIHITLYQRPGDAEPDRAELTNHALHLASGLGNPQSSVQVRLRDINGEDAAYIEMIDDGGDWWRAWHLADQTRLICLAYNCARSDTEVERADVDRMVDSFRWVEPRQTAGGSSNE